MEKKTDSATRERQGRPGKTYSPPRLVYYGDLAKLTRGGGGTVGDGGAAMSMIPCWIAEVLYGFDASQTKLIRSWLMDSYERRDLVGRIVVPVYSRVGPSVAGLLRRCTFLQSMFRPLFELALRHAHEEFAERAVLIQSR